MNKLKENPAKGKVTSIGVDLAKSFTQLNGDVVDDSVSLQKNCPSCNSLGLLTVATDPNDYQTIGLIK